MQKKFRHMTLAEKAARICGYAIWTDEELATWSQEDRDFYAFCIDATAEEVLVAVVGGLVVLLFCGFTVWANIVLG